VSAAVESVFADTARVLRSRLGLPPISSRAARHARERQNWPIYHGFSPLVVPRPHDWRTGLNVAGYWWPHGQPRLLPPRLTDFLAAGPPPVFVGLGSATVPDPEGLSAALVTALRRAGLRGVIQRGWGGLHADDHDMLTIDEVPHSVLFPKMAAVVHHAGAGTTAAGLRAGVPAVPVPVQFDAAFWSARLAALGVAPGAVPLGGFSATALTDALLQVTTDPSYRRRATDLGGRIRAEDGLRPVLAAVNRIAEA
jgi:UDP:flavonoid glycosyltransferase YjiC (YdhE family)